MSRRWLVLLSLLALVLTLAVGGVLWQGGETTSVAEIQGRIEHWKPLLKGLRLSLIGLVVLLWPYFVNALRRSGRIDAARSKDIQGQRIRLLTWLLVIELLLGQNLLGSFLATVQAG